ncbi:MAG: hypothetical protein H0U86_07720 [Chloroflexi bacterium]|nr:hypothetical protein [Chloroflexota bacterium]
MTLKVVLEVAPKRAFASAIDWPGWSRAAKTPDEALEALLAYAPRYAPVARRAKTSFRPPATVRGVKVVERLTGGGGTEFGVPGSMAKSERDPLDAHDLKRMLALLRASWAVFDRVAAGAVGVELLKGPRGGGRDLPKIIGHVPEAEVAYLAQLGSRSPAAADEDPGRPMALLRRTFTDALTAIATGHPVADPRNTQKPWPPRYAVRRSAWHVLDHAWEIQDRSRRQVTEPRR